VKGKPVEKMNTPLPMIEEAPGMADEDYKAEVQMRLDHISQSE